MSLFEKFQQIAAGRQALADRGITSNVVMEKVISSTEAVISGRHMILAGTNNYLGLTFDPDCIEAACTAVREQGTGTTGSRMANGTYSDHVQLEQELADFFECKYGMVFSTGYIANLAGCANLILKGVIGVSVMIWVRWTLPRLRIDQVITTCLKYCVPLAAAMFVGAMVWLYVNPFGG